MNDIVILPINANPMIKTYMHQAFKHAIMESDYYLSDLKCEVDLVNEITDAWKIEAEHARAQVERSRLQVYVDKYEKKGTVTVSRKCEEKDEMIVQVLYQQYTQPDGLIDFSIWSGDWENCAQGEHNTYKLGMVRRKGIFIFTNGTLRYGKKRDYEMDVYPIWIKLSKLENKVSAYTSEDGNVWNLLSEEELDLKNGEELNIGFRIVPLENQYYNWLFMNYLNICFNPNSSFIRLDYYNMPSRDYTYNYLHPFLVYNHYNSNEILDVYTDFHAFVHHELKHKRYVWMSMDEYYMPCRFAYGKQEYLHGNLIYGYDDEKRVYHIFGYREKVVIDELSYDDFELAVKESLTLNDITTVRYQQNVIPLEFNKKFFQQAIQDYLSGRNISYDTGNILPTKENMAYGIDVYKQLLASDKNTMVIMKDARAIYILWEHNKWMRECLDYLIAEKVIQDCANELKDEMEQILFLCEKLKLTVIEINIISKKRKTKLEDGIDKIRTIIRSIYMKEIGFYSQLYQLLSE